MNITNGATVRMFGAHGLACIFTENFEIFLEI
jgi:hypothetical protein